MRAGGVARILDARHAKVCQLDAPTGLYQQIGGFDVSVNNFLLVCIAQCRQQVAHDAQRLRQRVHLTPVEVVLKVVTFYKLHHQKCNVDVAVRVVDADDVGMLQTRGRPGLGTKTHLIFSRRFV